MMRHLRCIAIVLILLAGCGIAEEKEDSRCDGWRLDYLDRSNQLLNNRLTDNNRRAIIMRLNDVATRMRNAGCDDPPGLIL